MDKEAFIELFKQMTLEEQARVMAEISGKEDKENEKTDL